jgi:alpha-1,3-rhamnosyltransferase
MNLPLVSIIVATYHSAEYVLETLQSARDQTWPNIELIISDDGSTDNTVELCRRWLEENRHQFARTELITVPFNTGISANCNRCIQAARADWIKFIAGDDKLLPDCIKDNMDFVNENPEAVAIFSKVLLFKNNFEEANFLQSNPATYPVNIMDPVFTPQDQYKLLLLSDRITFTPSVFLHRRTLLEMGGYDENDRLIEDYPMWLKLTRAGYKLLFFEKATVCYRKHEAAASFKKQDGIFKPLLLKGAAIRKKNVYPYLPWDIVANERYILMISRFFLQFDMNRATKSNVLLYKISTVFLNPFFYILYLRKKIIGSGRNNVFYSGTVRRSPII